MVREKRNPRFRRVKPRPFVLTARDREILELVAEHRLLTSVQITALLGEGSSQKVLRRLQLLYHARFLDRPRTQIEDLVRNPGSRPMIYALGSAGASLLDVRIPKLPKLQYMDHTLGVSSVLVAFTLSCRTHGNVRLIPWREILETKVPEATRKKRSPDTWRVRLGNETFGVTPDAIFGLEYLDKPEGANRAWFFLEVDRGTMPVVRRDLRETSVYRKLLAYHATAAGELHTRHFGWKSFRVLTVTRSPEKKRLSSLVEAARSLPGLQGLFLFADEASLLARDALRSEWVNGRGDTTRLNG